MTQNSQAPGPPVTLSESAAGALKAVVHSSTEVENGDAVVRFSVKEQDSTISHQVTLESAPVENDLVFEQHGLTMVVAPEHVPALNGAHFDLQVDAGQPRLVVSNPNIVPE